MNEDVRVMIVDDHEIVRTGIAEIVERSQGLTVVAEAGSVAEALHRAELANPSVVLVDLQLPDGTGIDLIRQMKVVLPSARCVVLTSFDDDQALAESLEVGADERTVTRSAAKHLDPTEALTPTEKKILALIGDGLSNREIGENLGVAEKTVKNHITSLLAKMGLQRRTQVAAWVASQRSAVWRQSPTRGL